MIARFTILLCLCAMLVDSVGAYYGIYYGTDQKMANATYGFNIMIIEPYNFNLYKNYTGKKICYISVGEFDGTSDEL